jgi:23S rRNA (cytidine1920-2'-O)/16S rRNA (cytidine1409-2'-O)-methyltransferase
MKQRLDLALLERGLVPSRQVAQALIMSRRVTVDGRVQDKPGIRIDPDAVVMVEAPALSYVSRGGLKLAGALDSFRVDPTGSTVLDIGASTGGFTDCMLQRGAARVFAVDVGHGQIDWKLRNDSRVVVIERLNARYLSAADLPGLPDGVDIATVDVSFISLRLVLPGVAALLRRPPAPACILALVKPQFEVGRGKVGRGGIVRDSALRREALIGIARFAPTLGLSVRGLARSPIAGAEGNVEYFAHLGNATGGLSPEEIDNEATRLVDEEPADE